MEKKTGVVIISFGKAYHYAAQNLCFSIKHYNPNIHVTNIRGDIGLEYLIKTHNFFDEVIELRHEDMIEPALAKINVFNYLPYKNNLIVDADTLCLRDISVLLEDLKNQDKDFIIQHMGEGKFGDDISYDLWATHEDAFNFFDLDKEKDKWHTVQSSWYFVRKGAQTKKLHKELLKYWNKKFDKNKLKNKWGKFMPDELFFSGVVSKNKIDYKTEIKNIMYFGNNISPLSEVERNFFLSLHGQGIGQTTVKLMYWEYYDRVLHEMYRESGLNHIYKGNYIREGKVSNRA